jgi:hypothetical protein
MQRFQKPAVVTALVAPSRANRAEHLQGNRPIRVRHPCQHGQASPKPTPYESSIRRLGKPVVTNPSTPPSHAPAHTAASQEFSTLRDALTAAAAAINIEDGRPWIVTEQGDILSPDWIRANAGLAH